MARRDLKLDMLEGANMVGSTTNLLAKMPNGRTEHFEEVWYLTFGTSFLGFIILVKELLALKSKGVNKKV